MKNSLYFKYFFVFLRHKWFVFLAGLKTKAPLWRLLIHDISKLRPLEFKYYAKKYYGYCRDKKIAEMSYLKHVNRNPHHWQYYIVVDGTFEKIKPLEISDGVLREMVADWMAVEKSFTGEWTDIVNWVWLSKNWDRMIIHPISKGRLVNILNEVKKRYAKDN